MLAVLPFESLGAEPEQEYFADGLTEELIGHIGRLDPERLGVIARTSALRYRGSGKSVERIGSELGVEHLLEGSVRSDGRRLRLAARLVLVRDQSQVWSGSFERDWTDVLELQDELGRAVAAEIGLRLAPRGRAAAASVDVEAYHAYLRGRYSWNKRSVDGLHKAVEHFEQAIRTDAGYARAHAGLSDCYALLGDVGVAMLPPREAFALAAASARRALELDEELAEAHASAGHVLFHEYDWPASERAFLRALELDPNYATAAHWYAFLLAAAERHSDAEAMMRRALELDPVSLPIATDVGVLRYYARDLQGAVEQYRKTLELDPGFARAWATLGTACSRQGRHEEALAALEKAVALAPDPARRAALARVCAAAGRRERALELARGLERAHGYVAPYPIALIHVSLGDLETALGWLERARDEGSAELAFIRVDPWVDSLRSERRFGALLESLRPASASLWATEDPTAAFPSHATGPRAGQAADPGAGGLAPSRRRRYQNGAIAGALLVVGLAVLAWTLGRSGRHSDAFVAPRLQQLTFSEGVEEFPAWSPDGRTLAYSADRGPVRKILLKRLDGGEEVALTGGEADDIMPAWTPDGRTLAFVRAQQPGRRLQPSDVFGKYEGGDLWSIDLETRKERRLAEGAYDPAWSPDGTRLAVESSWAGPRRLWLLDAHGRNPQQLTTDASETVSHLRPRWSPDGGRLVFKNVDQTKFDVRVVDVTSKRLAWVTNDLAQDVDPAWSPSGRFIFFSSYRSGGLNLWRVPVAADGRPTAAPQQLTTGAGQDVQLAFAADGRRLAFTILGQNADLWRLPVSSSGAALGEPQSVVATTREDSRGAWSADGGSLAFNSDRAGHMNVWVHSLGDGSTRPLTHGPGGDFQPNWAPDGSRLAFFSNRSGNADVWTVDVKTGALEQLTHGTAVDANPFFSPDGRSIAYHSDSGGHMEVWVMKADGSAARPLTRVGVAGHFMRWTPDGRAVVFRSSTPKVQVFRVDVADGEPVPLAEVAGGSHISFSPDATAILDVVGHKALWLSPLTGGAPSKVFEFDDPSARIDYPVWSPDGRFVIFDRYRPQGGDVWVMRGLED
jgi:Tol biopolymer transport system component/TolB-like protein/Tfp pilus assembly protein PilF